MSNSSPFILKHYQREAVECVTQALSRKRLSLVEIGTGGGKTVVSAELAKRSLDSGRSVLLITKSWELVDHHRKIFERHLGHAHSPRIYRLGGDQSQVSEMTELKPKHTRGSARPVVVVTTLNTLYQRLKGKMSCGLNKKFERILWDECHWADQQSMGRMVHGWASAKKIKVVGLTATPKPEERSSFGPPDFVMNISDLLDQGLIASPIITQVDTKYAWTPTMNVTEGDYHPAALAQLNNRKRNEEIVAHYVDHRARYTRTIIFCVNIAHADALARLMSTRHIPVGVLHNELSKRAQTETVKKFKAGQIEVIINVLMLAHGVDIPEVDTLFMARPTRSKQLYIQMVGRGVRKVDDGAESFNLVEFTDNLTEHGMTPIDWCFTQPQRVSTPPRSRAQYRPSRPRLHHSFDSKKRPERLGKAIYPFMEGYEYLWFFSGQTFGVELELTSSSWFLGSSRAWREKAEHLIQALKGALNLGGASLVAELPGAYHGGSHKLWNVEADSSAGWEVTSRILRGYPGIVELGLACEALNKAAQEVQLKVNARTGFHLHLGWRPDLRALKRLIVLMHSFEPYLATLVAPSRIARFEGSGRYNPLAANHYCAPLSSNLDINRVLSMNTRREFNQYLRGVGRGLTLNLKPLMSYGTVEFRLHSGTLDTYKVYLWLSLCQQLLQAATSNTDLRQLEAELRRGVARRSVITPKEGLINAVKAYLPDGHRPEFLSHLAERQAEIAARVQGIPSLSPWGVYQHIS